MVQHWIWFKILRKYASNQAHSDWQTILIIYSHDCDDKDCLHVLIIPTNIIDAITAHVVNTLETIAHYLELSLALETVANSDNQGQKEGEKNKRREAQGTSYDLFSNLGIF